MQCCCHCKVYTLYAEQAQLPSVEVLRCDSSAVSCLQALLVPSVIPGGIVEPLLQQAQDVADCYACNCLLRCRL
jgi:hypothetical protein